MDWYLLTFLSFGFYVIQGIVMKYIATIGCDRDLTTFYCNLTVSLIALPVIILRGSPILSWVGALAAVINGISYSIATSSRLAALKELPVSIVYPVMRVNNAIVVVLLVVFLGESLTVPNIVGVLLAMASAYFIAGGEEA